MKIKSQLLSLLLAEYDIKDPLDPFDLRGPASTKKLKWASFFPFYLGENKFGSWHVILNNRWTCAFKDFGKPYIFNCTGLICLFIWNPGSWDTICAQCLWLILSLRKRIKTKEHMSFCSYLMARSITKMGIRSILKIISIMVNQNEKSQTEEIIMKITQTLRVKKCNLVFYFF